MKTVVLTVPWAGGIPVPIVFLTTEGTTGQGIIRRHQVTKSQHEVLG